MCRESRCLRPPPRAQESGRGEGALQEQEVPVETSGCRHGSRCGISYSTRSTRNSRLRVAPVSPNRHLKTDLRRHTTLLGCGRGQSFRVSGGALPEHLLNSKAEACASSLTSACHSSPDSSHTFREASSHQRSQLQELQLQEQQIFPTSCQQAPVWHTGSQRRGPGTAAPRFMLRPAST